MQSQACSFKMMLIKMSSKKYFWMSQLDNRRPCLCSKLWRGWDKLSLLESCLVSELLLVTDTDVSVKSEQEWRQDSPLRCCCGTACHFRQGSLEMHKQGPIRQIVSNPRIMFQIAQTLLKSGMESPRGLVAAKQKYWFPSNSSRSESLYTAQPHIPQDRRWDWGFKFPPPCFYLCSGSTPSVPPPKLLWDCRSGCRQ